MAQKFNFKLEGLLKLRSFKEQQVKVELGNILREIQQVEEEVVKLNEHIGLAYDGQEQVLTGDTDARLLQFFPYHIQAKRDDISNKENLIYALKKKYINKMEEMKVALGEVKLIDKLKENQRQEFNKAKLKKETEDLAEAVIMKKHYDSLDKK